MHMVQNSLTFVHEDPINETEIRIGAFFATKVAALLVRITMSGETWDKNVVKMTTFTFQGLSI